MQFKAGEIADSIRVAQSLLNFLRNPEKTSLEEVQKLVETFELARDARQWGRLTKYVDAEARKAVIRLLKEIVEEDLVTTDDYQNLKQEFIQYRVTTQKQIRQLNEEVYTLTKDQMERARSLRLEDVLTSLDRGEFRKCTRCYTFFTYRTARRPGYISCPTCHVSVNLRNSSPREFIQSKFR
jgi:hypothetical protein